ncbi:hypothetical protein QUW17_07920 [Bacteroides gallinaceum]|uniref:hypothetical protein n=1 Tax=Bacteroides gallinaceum TaxID=1462571 RepID=UPI0025A4AD3D|nr:hypothetical protein [Bacteroides gallinaceum]MDM8207804.1 hypothetical protein [Bacteroides gallinaceum]
MSAEQVSVYQNLIIVKDVKSERMSQYILTLIPSKAYDARYGSSVCGRFITRSDKGGFSGVAVYSCVYSAYTARVDTYKDGVKQEGVFLLNGTERGVSDAKADYARSLMSPLQVKRTKILMSRGEDDYFYEMPYEEVPSDDGWLSGVECVGEAPVTDWDGIGADGMTNDEWMSSTTPDSTVDPSPEDGTSNETDDVVSPDNTEVNQTPHNYNEAGLSDVLRTVSPILQAKGIDVSQYKIRLNEEMCWSNARTLPDNTIEICQEFFKYSSNDQASIIWHEIYHVNHEHNKEMTSSSGHISLSMPPDEICLSFKTYLNWYYKDISDEKARDDFIDSHLKGDLDVTDIRSSQWYHNEVETYQAEKNNGIEKSDYYEGMVDFLLWKYGELEKLTE